MPMRMTPRMKSKVIIPIKRMSFIRPAFRMLSKLLTYFGKGSEVEEKLIYSNNSSQLK
jgi:hypothetical protein